MEFDLELEIAVRTARRAGEVALRYWRKGVIMERKADASPVSEADLEAEWIISEGISAVFPRDGLLGEEGCHRDTGNGRRWLIDPIDGTRDFVRGNRQWAVQMALEANNQIVAAVCHFPALDETYWAIHGGGAFCNGERVRVSNVASAADAVLCFNGLHDIGGRPQSDQLAEFLARFWTVRSFSGSADAMQVVSGKADAWINLSAMPWDLAPVKLLIEEAGGVFRNFNGASAIDGENCFTCTPALEEEIAGFVAD